MIESYVSGRYGSNRENENSRSCMLMHSATQLSSAGEPGGNRLSDQLSVKPPIFNKNLVRVHACDDDSREVNSAAFTLQSFRIGPRTPRVRFQGNSRRVEKFQIRLVPRHRDYEAAFQRDFSLRR